MDFGFTAEHEQIRAVSRRLAADFATRSARQDRETSLPVEALSKLQKRREKFDFYD